MMLTFGKIPKIILTIVCFWLFYAFFGYELTVITGIGCILGQFWSKSDLTDRILFLSVKSGFVVEKIFGQKSSFFLNF